MVSVSLSVYFLSDKKCVYFVFIFQFTLSLSVTIVAQKQRGYLESIQF